MFIRTFQKVGNYAGQIPGLWFGERIPGLHSFSRKVAGKERVKLAKLLSQNHPIASVEVNCRGLKPREVRKLLRRVIRLNKINNPRTIPTLEAQRAYIKNVKTKFSSDNIIHKILSIESNAKLVVSSDDVDVAYKILAEILEGVKGRLSDKMKAEDKLHLVYKIMEEKGFKLIKSENILLIDSLLERTLDCDASGFIILAIAEQLGWPVKLASASNHIFVRWEGRDTKINIDAGVILEDQFFIEEFSWNGHCLDSNGVIAACYFNRGAVMSSLGLKKEAMQDYDEAIRLNPKFTPAYINRGMIRYEFGQYEKATQDFKKAKKLNPTFTAAYINSPNERTKL